MNTILLVEPEGDGSSELSGILRQPDWELIFASGREQLRQRLAGPLPQLVVLDLTVENGRGLELCHLIRETPGADLLPVLFIGTGTEGVRNFGDALVEGGDYYFQKPVAAPLLLAKIRSYVGSTVPPGLTATAAAVPGEASCSEKIDDRVERLLELGASFREGLLKPQLKAPEEMPAPPAPSEPLPPPPVVIPPPPAAAARKPAAASTPASDLETIMSQLAEELALVPEAAGGEPPGLDLSGPAAENEPPLSADQAPRLRLEAEELARRELDRRLCGELLRRPTLSQRLEETPASPAATFDADLARDQEQGAGVARAGEAAAAGFPRPVGASATTAAEAEGVLEADKFWSEPEAGEQSFFQPVPTRTNTGRLLELLQHEAVLARRKAMESQETEPEEEGEPTRPGLPPRPGEKTVEVVRLDALRAGAAKAVSDAAGRPSAQPKPRPPEAGKTAHPRPSAAAEAEEDELASVFVEPPRPLFRPPQPQECDLRQESTPELFWRLHRQKVTGMLVFRNAGTQKTVFFENGIPVGLQSSLVFDRLEEFLLRESLIDRQIHAEARIRELSARSMAAYLVERGVLTAEEFFPVLRRHFLEGLLSLFEWQEGGCVFSEAYAPDSEKLQLQRSPAWLVLEGIRRKYPLERLLAKLGGPATLAAAVPAESWPVKAGELALLPEERKALALVNGTRTVEEIVFQSGQSEEVVYRTLLAASILGLVVVTARGLAAEREEQLRGRLQTARRRLEHKHAQLDKASYFELLGVSPRANAYEIEQAYRRLRREFHPAAYGHPQLADLAPKLQALLKTLEEARDVLGDELLRESYRASLDTGR